MPPQLLRHRGTQSHSQSERYCDCEQSVWREASSAASSLRCCRPKQGTRGQRASNYTEINCFVTALQGHSVDSGERGQWPSGQFSALFTLCFLVILFTSIKNHLCSLQVCPSFCSFICCSHFYLWLSLSSSPFIYLTGFSFSCFCVRIFFIPKSFFFTLQSKSVLPLLYNNISVADSQVESHIQ